MFIEGQNKQQSNEQQRMSIRRSGGGMLSISSISVRLPLIMQLALLSTIYTTAHAAVAAQGRPNFVFVLADDLNYDYKQDRKAFMPNLKKHFAEEGLEFFNHVAVYSVCGPSRSSLLAGRYPHNTGYVANAKVDSVKAWLAEDNETIGSWLTRAGYHTAFLGKYVNGVECTVPAGWGYWGGLTCTSINGTRVGGTYNYYNASQWNVSAHQRTSGEPHQYLIHTGVHQVVYSRLEYAKQQFPL